MRRRELLALIGGATAASGVARAQQMAMPVVGRLASYAAVDSGFTDGLNETGYADGRNVRFVNRNAYDQYDLLPEMAADLVRRRVDVIAAYGTTEALAARRATQTIPTVFLATDDPVTGGFTTNLDHPDGSLTGVLMMDDALMPERLDLLSTLVPQAKAFALMVNPRAASTPAVVRSTREAAHAKGVQLHVLEAATDAEINSAFGALGQMQVGGLIVDDGDASLGLAGLEGQLLSLAARDTVPAIYGWDAIAQVGGLISYGPNRVAARRRMGVYVGKILGGAKPADLSFVKPDKFELFVNLPTAKALGLAVPPTLLAKADTVIK